MAADVSLRTDTLEIGKIQTLFEARRVHSYDVSTDKQKFHRRGGRQGGGSPAVDAYPKLELDAKEVTSGFRQRDCVIWSMTEQSGAEVHGPAPGRRFRKLILRGKSPVKSTWFSHTS
jgi:hypothetical protein